LTLKRTQSSFSSSFTRARFGDSNFHTNEEQALIDKFRPLVTAYLTLDYMKTDSYLLRWIKAGDSNLAKAVDLLKKSYKWRQDNKVDELMNEDLEAHQRYMPYNLDGYDRKGRPLLLLYFGKWDIRKYSLAGRRDIVLKYWQQMTELLENKAYEAAKMTGKDITQFYYLNDMDGYTLRQHACLPCIPLMYDLVSQHDPNHPYFIANVTLVNSPRIFSPVLAVMKTIVPGPTLRVINDYGYDKGSWQRLLLNDIAPEYLTPNFGGTKKY